jgi:hypothetical protein
MEKELLVIGLRPNPESEKIAGNWSKLSGHQALKNPLVSVSD